MTKILLFDLDGTLLRSDKTISPATFAAIETVRNKGILIGISTARSVLTAGSYLQQLRPDLAITGSGALVCWQGEEIYRVEFTEEETRSLIARARELAGADCEITVDTVAQYFENYHTWVHDPSMGETIHTDYENFNERAQKFCAFLKNGDLAPLLAQCVDDCHYVRFSGTDWYMFTRTGVSKARAMEAFSRRSGIPMADMCAFGDDYSDMEMLKLCGRGIAMGNAIEPVKAIADEVIGTNDADGIAHYLANIYDL